MLHEEFAHFCEEGYHEINRWLLQHNVQAEVDRAPTREVTGEHVGPATIEGYTVMHDHNGPNVALIAALTPQGVRTFARSTDPATMAKVLAGH